ncbi:protein abrupt-like isoform X2 [Periplaneta americana]|uniref:protein abrupt-like isoform X2 n=1 Tax=Periplaneta americana TaxID=6978 RepID=UPI0037E95B57
MEEESSSSKLQLCLTWNSFTDNIINSLESSYGDGDFVDVTLACEGESIKAHKLVLSACSQYLKRLLKENPCPHPIIILKDVGLAELKDLLVYMYHGEVRVEQDRIAKLLHTAQILEVRGLRDINQRLDQELDSGGVNEASNLVTNQNRDAAVAEEYNSNQQNKATKTGTTVQTSSALKSPAGRKARPVPMLQCIQQSAKADGSSAVPMTVDRDEDEGGGEESNNSLALDHTVFLDEVRVKEEAPDVPEQFDDYATNQSSTLDENSSEADQREFNNGYGNPSPVLATAGGGSLGTGSGLMAAQMLKRVATRASSNEAVPPSMRDTPSLGSILLNSSMTDQAGSGVRTHDESRSEEVTVSLFNNGSKQWKAASSSRTVRSPSTSETDKHNHMISFKPWRTLMEKRNEDRQDNSILSDKSHENLPEIMELDSPEFSRKDPLHQNSEQQMYSSGQPLDVKSVRPTLYAPKEKITSRYEAIEHMLNISPQLRLQMLMCREYKKYTNILLVAMFGRDMLATHSLNGTGTSKPRLDCEKVNCVIEAVMTKFGVDQHHVKEAIRIKLNNEDKLKKRLTQKVSTSFIGLQ